MATRNSQSMETESRIGGDDAYTILGLDPVFDLDLRALRSRWMRAAADVHPDAQGAVLTSARVNDAFRILCDPLSRAEILLTRFGFGELARDDVARKALPPEFLVEMMEYREEVDRLGPNDVAARSSLRELARSKRDAAIAEIARAFREITHATQDEGARVRAVREVLVLGNVVRSFDRMLEQLDREFGADST